MQEWVVVLEVAGDSNDPAIELNAFRHVLNAVADCRPAALHNPDRYALQLHVLAEGPVESVRTAISRWHDSVVELGLPLWNITSVEVVTSEEFARQLRYDEAVAPTPFAVQTLSGRANGHGLAHAVLERAFSDELTHLPGSGLFSNLLERSVAQARSTQTTLALIVVAVDDFRSILETLGPDRADDAVVHLARVLKSTLRPTDTAARLEADRFGVLLEDVPSAGAPEAVARRILSAVSPCPDGGGGFRPTASAGIALSAPDDTAQTLLEHASTALAAAQHAGRAGCVVVGPEPAPSDDRGAVPSARSRYQ